jgi:hypothetical protein
MLIIVQEVFIIFPAMKKVFFLMLICVNAYASTNDSLRVELSELLRDRQKLFDEYTASLNQKSGLFGNKTKGDLRDSQDKLREIVTADNKIMSVLNRTVDFRNYEKVNLKYDASSYQQRIENLTTLNESLLKQNNEYANEVTDNKAAIKKLRLYNILMGFVLLIVIGMVGIKKYLRR